MCYINSNKIFNLIKIRINFFLLKKIFKIKIKMSKLEHFREISKNIRENRFIPDNIKSLKKNIEKSIDYFDLDKIHKYIIAKYNTQKNFSKVIGKKYHDCHDTNISMESPSVVSKALKGGSGQLGTVLYYLIIEHIDFDITLCEKQSKENNEILKTVVEEQAKQIEILKASLERSENTADRYGKMLDEKTTQLEQKTIQLDEKTTQLEQARNSIKKINFEYQSGNSDFGRFLKEEAGKYM